MLPGGERCHRRLRGQLQGEVFAQGVNIALRGVQPRQFLELERHLSIDSSGDFEHPALGELVGHPVDSSLDGDGKPLAAGLKKHPHVVPDIEVHSRCDLRKRHCALAADLLLVILVEPLQHGLIRERRREPGGQQHVRSGRRSILRAGGRARQRGQSRDRETNHSSAYFRATSTRDG